MGMAACRGSVSHRHQQGKPELETNKRMALLPLPRFPCIICTLAGPGVPVALRRRPSSQNNEFCGPFSFFQLMLHTVYGRRMSVEGCFCS